MHVLLQKGLRRKGLPEETKNDEEKEKGKANVTEETYHDKILFGDGSTE